jgi:phenylacetate-coenzyme A ligase PaaK-like adenylate-forming protein
MLSSLTSIRGTSGPELLAFIRFLIGLPRFLKTPISYDDAEATVIRNASRREQRLIDKLETAVFSYPRSPYRKLFDTAGLSKDEVIHLIRTYGVEEALNHFRSKGVYVTWDEFKGRRPVCRGERTFHFQPEDFDNPIMRTSLSTSSSGSSGVPVRVGNDLEDNTQSCVDWAVLFRAWGLEESPLLFWTVDYAGMAIRYLKCSKIGKHFERWFITTPITKPGERFRARLVHGYTRFWAKYPKPELAPLHACEPLFECLWEYLDEGRLPILNCTPSGALELSRRSLKAGRSLKGVYFLLGAEPLSAARRDGIVASGATVIPTYGTSEGGWIGAQFPGVDHPDEVCIFRDAYAVIPSAEHKDVFDGKLSSTPLFLTNLRPAAPKVLINTGIGDCGYLSDHSPSDYTKSLGFTLRLHHIRSHRKVTAFGSTFALTDLTILLEEIMPHVCGGGPTDYQLIESEENGIVMIILRVHPRVGGLNNDELRRVFLEELEKLQHFYGPMTAVLEKSSSLVVKREVPVIGSTGKLSPIITIA